MREGPAMLELLLKAGGRSSANGSFGHDALAMKYGRVENVRKLMQLDQGSLSCDIMAGAVAIAAADAAAGCDNSSNFLDELLLKDRHNTVALRHLARAVLAQSDAGRLSRGCESMLVYPRPLAQPVTACLKPHTSLDPHPCRTASPGVLHSMWCCQGMACVTCICQ